MHKIKAKVKCFECMSWKMHVVNVPMVLPARPVKTPQAMQESELLNTSEEKDNS